jgi:hypothetical protein
LIKNIALNSGILSPKWASNTGENSRIGLSAHKKGTVGENSGMGVAGLLAGNIVRTHCLEVGDIKYMSFKGSLWRVTSLGGCRIYLGVWGI